jgi:hypothetical protein
MLYLCVRRDIYDAHFKYVSLGPDRSISTGPNTPKYSALAPERFLMDVERYVSDNAQKVCLAMSRERREVLTPGIVLWASE